MMAVVVRDLVVRFGGRVALAGVDLRIEPGELFLLLGPSGCGKTTLLRTVAGFITPVTGSVSFGDRDVTQVPAHLRNTGMVFQTFALWPHLSVGENVAFGLKERKVERREAERRTREALFAVRMADHFARRVDQLSGGEQQRVALARALVVRPSCLLLDEPLSNLDAKLRHSMRDEIRRICKEFGLTALYVTHDQKEALAVADRIAVMRAGRVLQVGTPAEIYRTPCSRSVATFIGETNLLQGSVTRAEGGALSIESPIGEIVARPASPPLAAVGAQVVVSLRPECVKFSESDSGLNHFSGELAETLYLGELAEHRVRVAGEVLRVYELNPKPGRTARRTLAIAPEDVTVLPFDGTGE